MMAMRDCAPRQRRCNKLQHAPRVTTKGVERDLRMENEKPGPVIKLIRAEYVRDLTRGRTCRLRSRNANDIVFAALRRWKA